MSSGKKTKSTFPPDLKSVRVIFDDLKTANRGF
jgi:hypothetical protein